MAMMLLQASLASAAAAGAQQLDTLRRVGPTASNAGKALVKTAGVVLSAHADTYSAALRRVEEAEADVGPQQAARLLSAAMGMQRDAAAQQLRLLQDLAGSSPHFDSDEFIALLEASALRVGQVADAHVQSAVARVRRMHS